jgi:hypothetical protein
VNIEGNKKKKEEEKSEPLVYKSARGQRCSMTSCAAMEEEGKKKLRRLKLNEIMRSSHS